MNSPVGIATASVAGEGLEAYTSEDVGLQALRATATMVAFGPGTLKGEAYNFLVLGINPVRYKSLNGFPHGDGESRAIRQP